MMDELNLTIDRLIDGWCARRALSPLRILLAAWPMPMALTDDWESLRTALQLVRAVCRDVLPADELHALGRAIAIVDQAIERRR